MRRPRAAPAAPAGPPAAELRTALREAGLRSTAARVAVMEALHRQAGPVSHPELAQDPSLEGFDRATIYRNLIDLAEAGLVTRGDLGDHVWRFELRRETSAHAPEHPHFVCTDCGDVSCVDETIALSTRQRRAIRGQVQEILLKGVCEKCS